MYCIKKSHVISPLLLPYLGIRDLTNLVEEYVEWLEIQSFELQPSVLRCLSCAICQTVEIKYCFNSTLTVYVARCLSCRLRPAMECLTIWHAPVLQRFHWPQPCVFCNDVGNFCFLIACSRQGWRVETLCEDHATELQR